LNQQKTGTPTYLSLSGGVHHWLKRRSTREERTPVTRYNNNNNNNTTNNNNNNLHWFNSPSWALAFLRSFCQLKYPAITSSDFVTRGFSRVGLSAPCPTPGYPGGPL
jgi:hypothetical protein